jgi:hypothetical protein
MAHDEGTVQNYRIPFLGEILAKEIKPKMAINISLFYCGNIAAQLGLRLDLCRRRQAVIARTFGISPAHRR